MINYTDSILTSTKKSLGIEKDYNHFDPDLIMHINTVLATLHQLGIGPSEGFFIEDDGEEWSDLFGDDPRLSFVRTFVHLKVKLAFDPPLSSAHIDALKGQISELEWRISIATDEKEEEQ